MKKTANILFATYGSRNLEPQNTIGAKWERLLAALPLAKVAAKQRVAVKMHLGGGYGFSTIHPYLVRKLVQDLYDVGAGEVFVCDSPGAVRNAVERGYTSETIGCQIVPVAGTADKYFYSRKITPPYLSLEEVELAGEIVDADALVDFAHIKGHGCCGFGGVSKNLSMGAVVASTRRKLHALEGGLDWDATRCTHCGKCAKHCPNHALTFDDDNNFCVDYHACKFCQHCILICPQKAITMSGNGYHAFQEGMARVSAEVLKTFAPGRTLFISLLQNITVFCDCWGMTTPSLVPDIGIIAGTDIVATEKAALDLIRSEDFIPGSLPPGMTLSGKGHLFEQIHGKNPYVIVDALEALGCGTSKYRLTEID
ncbi:MAG: DUF362 domain-containing protein [Lentisphaerae bacterium]|nr:DUF362 domain-containing protein [Lentisphaerota bacterium]